MRYLWLTLLLLPSLVLAQDEEPFFEVRHLRDSIHMLEPPGAGGNIGVLSGPDGVLLIDDRFERDIDALQRALDTITDRDVDFVVNTHIHPDHIGGNNALAAEGAIILAHDHVRLRMLEELRIPRDGGRFLDQPPEGARPVITYNDAISFHLNGQEVRVFRAPPAHTDGDSFVHFRGSNVLHLGDVFRTNMYPIVDRYNGGSFLGMIEAMEQAMEMADEDTLVIPGHGSGIADRGDMQQVLAMLRDIRDRVADLIDQGMTLEETLEANPTAEYDERWGQVDSWNESHLVPVIYEELQNQ